MFIFKDSEPRPLHSFFESSSSSLQDSCLSSESGESLRHVGCYPGKQDSMWRCGVRAAGAALDPPLWTVVPNKALSLSLSLSLNPKP